MAGQVTLPGVGGVSRTALWWGGGAAAAVMAVLWWRKRNAAKAAPAAPVDVGVDDGGGSGMAGGGGALTGPSVSSATAPTTNADWTRAAMAALSFQDPSGLAQALGRYLAGQAVTADQEGLIDQAIAVEGYPPVAGPSGYPPGIRTQPDAGQTTATAPVTAPAPVTPPPAPAPAPAQPAEVVYTFRSGDTLSSVAARYGMTASQLYNFGTNAASLEQYAQWHGLPSSNGGSLIWPGYNIGVPA